MSILLIYTPQNGEYLKTVLDAMVTLVGTATFKSAMDIMMILAVSMVSYQYICGKKLESLFRFIVLSFFVLYGLIGLRVNVAIVDMQTADSTGPALTVDNVPLGTALPAALISGIGYGITKAFSFAFHMPDDLDYTKTGMIFGARTWLASTGTELSMSPELARDLSSYIRQCVFSAKLLGSQQISPNMLKNSSDLINLYFKEPSPIYHVMLHSGKNVSCINAARILKPRFSKALNKELQHLSYLMARGNKDKFNNSLSAAHQYYMKVSKNAADILTQNILINSTRNAAADAFAFAGADAELMNFTNTTSLQKMHVAEANSFWLASFRLPYYMTVMWMLTICIFPLVVLIALFPTMKNVYVIYLQSQVYLWSWPPMFIIIHFFVSLAASSTITLFGKKTGGVTFSTIDSIANLHSFFAYTAGALAASVPFLAYQITKGLPSVLSTASQHFGGMAQSLSVSEAQSATQGNVSMASYSGWNMNYENTNAHKFDTNYQHMEGRATVQTENGALLSEVANGSRIGNVSSAISSAAVSVHGSERVIDSLHQSANESFNHASSLRTAGDKHLQTGLSELANFTTNDSNDYRSGEGKSITSTDSYSSDLRKMQDAIHQFNKHHDGSLQISAEAAITGRINSSKSLIGKGVEWVSGASGEVSMTGRTGVSTSHSIQKFNNSSYGKSFNEAFNHMVSTAQNNHLDATDTHNLSKSEQIAANFAKGQSLIEQSSSEYAHSAQLQQAASHAKEEAMNIDQNLNQAYHDWVISHYGSRGEQVMLQTDTQSIQQQDKWVNEFLNSNRGQQALSVEVHQALSQSQQDLLTAHHTEASKIQAAHSVRNQYASDASEVGRAASAQGLMEMNSSHLADAKKLQRDNHELSVKEDAENIMKKVSEPIKDNQELYKNNNHVINKE
ncbi:conjugal transfer protein TraG N-terminal domain-containing protein [Legionella septentrionalis]|uniref:conjugal transfer protein TraG N-terminal domain-containing protein n=1 Tax=Legionella septentrionalis TaxID=2498109 RepID=UPI000F8E2F79|nr:conjugal transfer protein TraG N-terminal domain-containing protein [Legionella septentrionalis]RUQ96661.1 conjugal transfer protein TraG [Legionella septentrionalis]